MLICHVIGAHLTRLHYNTIASLFETYFSSGCLFFEVSLLSGDIFSLYKHYNVIFISDLFVARTRGDCGNFPSRPPLLFSFYRMNNVTTFIKAMSKSYIQKGTIFMTVSVSEHQLRSANTFKKDVFFWQIFNILL